MARDLHASLGSEVDALSRAVRDLDRRLAAVEQRLADDRPRALPLAATPADLEVVPAAPADLTGPLALAGRTLLVFGGAYLLRAVTESGHLPRAAGIAIGLAYALVWLLAAWRRAPLAPADAGFHAAAWAATTFAILIETTTRGGGLAPSYAAIALAAAAAVGLAVAWMRRAPAIAWVTVVTGAPALAVLMLGRGAVTAPLLVLILIGVASTWLAYLRGWTGPRWVAAAALDVVLLLLVPLVANRRIGLAPGAAAALLVAPAVLYLASFLAAAARGRRLGLFAWVQGHAMAVIGIGGALLLPLGGGGRLAVGAVALALGAACHAGAARAPRESPWSFRLVSSLALATTLAAALAAGSWAPHALAVLALLLTLGANLRDRADLAVHGAAMLLLAALLGGTVTAAAYRLAAPATVAWPAAAPAEPWVLLAALLSAWLTLRGREGRLAAIVGSVVLSVLALAAAGTAVRIAAPALAGDPPGADPATLAAVRTVALTAVAVGLAVALPGRRRRDLFWLPYALLVLSGIKLLVEDLPQGGSASRFVALAACGIALLVASRLARHGPERPSPP